MEHHSIKYINVSRGTFNKVDDLIRLDHKTLNSYLDQLLWWNNRINLVSRNVPRETIMEHIRHSLILTQLKIYEQGDYIVDSGTGGGLPGLPLAIISQGKEFLINDISSKKTLALKQMVRKLGLENVQIRGGSISEVNINKSFVLISKHAFKIPELLNFAKGLPWSSMVFYKGINFKKEIADINIPLNINVYDLYENNEKTFYEGKFLVELSKK